MKFSLVIPCFNEAANLPILLSRCEKLTEVSGVEVILVDNGSSDNTSEVLLQLLTKYPSFRSVRVVENKGYGYGILAGLQVAKGEILGWTHADMQADPQDVFVGLDIFDKYGQNAFVKGKRYGRPIIDMFFTIGMSIFETVLLRKLMWDINAQPTMFSRQFFESWSEPPNDFSLDLYAYYKAHKKNLKVYRFPVRFGERAHGVSHWNLNWSSKIKFIRRTLDFSIKLKKKL
jgi:glycosyltransferase involved in cell wall biosynthesis